MIVSHTTLRPGETPDRACIQRESSVRIECWEPRDSTELKEQYSLSPMSDGDIIGCTNACTDITGTGPESHQRQYLQIRPRNWVMITTYRFESLQKCGYEEYYV